MKPVTPERAAWLLAHPLNSADLQEIPAEYVHRFTERDGAILTVTLAVDR